MATGLSCGLANFSILSSSGTLPHRFLLSLIIRVRSAEPGTGNVAKVNIFRRPVNHESNFTV
jgi:hypothetical protein